MKIKPDNALLQYCGRIDFENTLAPVFVYAGSYVKIRFRGSAIAVEIQNKKGYFDNYLGYILDGAQGKILLSDQNDICTYSIKEELTGEEHELLLFKRMDGCHYFTFLGFEVSGDGALMEMAPRPNRRIEVFGDSVSCGEVSEAVEYVGKSDPVNNGEYSNSWYSYSWMTARKLGAELHITAQGGISLMDKIGWFNSPDYVGLETVYDKIEYNPALGNTKSWDFNLWKPHVVIFAFGQNDANPVNFMANDYHSEASRNWRLHYRKLVERLMEVYPKAHFILTTTILEHDASWDRAIEEVCNSMADAHVHHFLYSNNGSGTPGHIRIPEAEKMAEELSQYILTLGDIWNG